MIEIDSRDYVKEETIYKTGSVEVFKAKLIKTNQEIAVKKLRYSTTSELNIMQNEWTAMVGLDNPNIVQLIGFKNDSSDRNDKFVLLFMDYFPRGDLSKEIKRRSLNNDYWREEDLWNHFKSLIQAHSYLQTKGLAHRDIKPQNIFVGDNGTLKVADLGCALKREEQEKTMTSEHTIAGTPLYLSPLLRKAYMDYSSGMTPNMAKHNPFKSDVYSLGLTFLYMASLKDVSDLADLRTMGKGAQRINELRYNGRIKNLLTDMLQYDEHYRPNFIRLEEIYFSNTPQGNMQVIKKLNTFKPHQISDLRMLHNKFQIKVFTKASQINAYITYVLNSIINANNFSVWCLIELAKSMNYNIKIGTLNYRCFSCNYPNANHFYCCNSCGLLNLLHKACLNQCIIINESNNNRQYITSCFQCNQSNVVWNEEITNQQKNEIEFKENYGFNANDDIPTDICKKCKTEQKVIIYDCKHRFCGNCLVKYPMYKRDLCILCPLHTVDAYAKSDEFLSKLKSLA